MKERTTEMNPLPARIHYTRNSHKSHDSQWDRYELSQSGPWLTAFTAGIAGPAASGIRAGRLAQRSSGTIFGLSLGWSVDGDIGLRSSVFALDSRVELEEN